MKRESEDSMTEAYGYKGRQRVRMNFEVTLTCGHTIKVRNEPLHPAVRFGCTAGQSCGYFLYWKAVKNIATGITEQNMYQPPSEGNEDDTMIPQQKEE